MKTIPVSMAAYALGSTSAAAQEAETPPAEVAAEPPPELKALAESCSAHKFETMVTASADAVARPRLSIRCAMPRETCATCARMERETQLMIRAEDDLPAGTSVRFLRGGNARAELELGTLKKGASLREKLPGGVCSGVLRGKVQVQILNNGRVAETLGPYSLYCGS